MIFLYKDFEYSYEKLINDLNSVTYIYDNPLNLPLYKFYVNLLSCFINDIDLIVSNSINEENHLDIYKTKYICSKIAINNKITDLSHLSDLIRNSNSSISLYTTGTTGTPKLVKHKVDSFLKNVKDDKDKLHDSWALCYNPLHTAGLQVFFQSILNSNSLIYCFDSYGEKLYQLIEKYAINCFSATPTFYRNNFSRKKHISVKYATLGGEKSDKKIIDLLKQLFPYAKILNIYASTESGAILTSDSEFFYFKKINPKKIKIIKNEIHINKKYVGQSSQITDKWFSTGDYIEKLDSDRFLIKGRVSNTINVGGYRVSLDEIEDVIRASDFVIDCCVYSIENSIIGNLICANVVLKEVGQLDVLKTYLKNNLTNYKYPRKIIVKDTISMNKNGKKNIKNILITGASRGLGLSVVKLLLENNYYVYGLSRNKTKEVSDLLIKFEDNFKFLEFDLQKTDNINHVIFKNFLKNVKLHGFVNNAAFAYDDILTNASIESLKKMYDVNVFSPIIMSKYVVRRMISNRIKGSLIHVSSISVHTGYKGLSMYASSKGALEAFSKNLAREWGGFGIRSNCIVSGFMDTEMSSTLSDDQKNRIYLRTSLKKPTNPISIANTIMLLLSNKSESITGQNIHVDSGTI